MPRAPTLDDLAAFCSKVTRCLKAERHEGLRGEFSGESRVIQRRFGILMGLDVEGVMALSNTGAPLPPGIRGDFRDLKKKWRVYCRKPRSLPKSKKAGLKGNTAAA